MMSEKFSRILPVKAAPVSNPAISSIKFTVLNDLNTERMSKLELLNRELYNVDDEEPVPYGPLDKRLGGRTVFDRCETCGNSFMNCPGHFGNSALALPVYIVGYVEQIRSILNKVCSSCGRILLPPNLVSGYSSLLRQAKSDQERERIYASISEQITSIKNCPYCSAKKKKYTKKKKGGKLEIILSDKSPTPIFSKQKRSAYESLFREIYDALKGEGDENALNEKNLFLRHEIEQKIQEIGVRYLRSNTIDYYNYSIIRYGYQKLVTMNTNASLQESQITEGMKMVNPMFVKNVFSRIRQSDVIFLGMNPETQHPLDLLVSNVPVPPTAIRPTVVLHDQGGTNEDDLTIRHSNIIRLNNLILRTLETGLSNGSIMNIWEALIYEVAEMVDGDITYNFSANVPGRKQKKQTTTKGIVQRLKGKKGRFRGNLSGKRVDFSGRTVISPDPNLEVFEVSVPRHMAKILTFPEVVNRSNIKWLAKLVANGMNNHPGAVKIRSKTSGIIMLYNTKTYEEALKMINIGDIVERHLIDGDIVLFNRQPSLHRMSIMALMAKVSNRRTLSFNECICSPFNADFDGDEMNLHLPQNLAAKSEAKYLMSTVENLKSPRNGQMIIGGIQDFITAGFLLTSKDTFFDEENLMQMMGYLDNCAKPIELPPPTIYKPKRLWSGKVLVRYIIGPEARVTFETKGRLCSNKKIFDPNDRYIVFRDSDLLFGRLDSSVMGSGGKKTIFYHIIKNLNAMEAAKAMGRMTRLLVRYFTMYGFSLGISDVSPSPRLQRIKEKLIEDGYKEAALIIESFKKGTLVKNPGQTLEETMESKVGAILSDIRDKAGSQCLIELQSHNSALIMSQSGSKGSPVNISQMIAQVGQQSVAGKRIPAHFERNRPLPYYLEDESKDPAARGFVSSSFFEGLTPMEFFYHTMAGREGLIDTAVKTAETGYMQRRLVKALEDLHVAYDYTVRNAQNNIVQFRFGDDGLDAIEIVSGKLPFNIEAKFDEAKRSISPGEKPLSPSEISSIVSQRMSELIGTALDTDMGTDSIARKFLELETDPPVSVDFVVELFSFFRKLFEELEATPDFMLESKSIGRQQLNGFLDLLVLEYSKAICEPGTSVGAISAQSIGEPATQMTLKTFHFAGLASMNITQGVPRIREIINATEKIKTPIITAELVDPENVEMAERIRSRIEGILLEEICEDVTEVVTESAVFFVVKFNRKLMNELKIDELDPERVVENFKSDKKLKGRREGIIIKGDVLYIDPISILEARSGRMNTLNEYVERIRSHLGKLTVVGYSDIDRAIIQKFTEHGKSLNRIICEGTGYMDVLCEDGIDFTRTKSNSTLEVEKVLGIEAARQTIINETQYTMSNHGINVSERHLKLLADLMTFQGKVLGITRHGIGQMKNSVLMMASFERTTPILFKAAGNGVEDPISGVSENIIVGGNIPVGTGMFHVLWNENSGLGKGKNMEKAKERSKSIYEKVFAN